MKYFLYLYAFLLTFASCSLDHDKRLLKLIEDSGGVQAFVLEQPPLENRRDSIMFECGKKLFFEKAIAAPKFGIDTSYSCASCHLMSKGGANIGVFGIGEGGMFDSLGNRVIRDGYVTSQIDFQRRSTPTFFNIAYNQTETVLWDGGLGGTGDNRHIDFPEGHPNSKRLPGDETQGFKGQEVHRTNVEKLRDLRPYVDMFSECFPQDTSPINRDNAAFMIAFYERRVVTSKAPFQRWLRGENEAMTDRQKQGALLFFGKSNCVSCHYSPALGNTGFHRLGFSDMFAEQDDVGRYGITKYSSDLYKFKVPQLYNSGQKDRYGHGSSLTTIDAAIQAHYDPQEKHVGTEITTKPPTYNERQQLIDFIENALLDPAMDRYMDR